MSSYKRGRESDYSPDRKRMRSSEDSSRSNSNGRSSDRHSSSSSRSSSYSDRHSSSSSSSYRSSSSSGSRPPARIDPHDRRNDRPSDRDRRYNDHRNDRHSNSSRYPPSRGNDRYSDRSDRRSDRDRYSERDRRSDRERHSSSSDRHSERDRHDRDRRDYERGDRHSSSSSSSSRDRRSEDRYEHKEEEKESQQVSMSHEEDDEDAEYQKQLQEMMAKQESEEERLRKARERRQAILEKYKKVEEEKKEDEKEEDTPKPEETKPEENGKKEEENGKKEEENGKKEETKKEEDQKESSSASSPIITGNTPSPESPGSWFFNDDEEFLGQKTSGSTDQKAVDDGVEEYQDESGYFVYKPGLLLGQGGRYKLVGRLGVGQYSNVFKAIDLKPSGMKGEGEKKTMHVAIKMLRHIDQMSEKDLEAVALNELKMLQLLANKDPKDKYSIVRLLDSFEDKEHLCLVFESLELNLRELMHQYGKNIGLNIDAVRLYGRRLALALYHLKRCDILHADFKLDNVLVGEDRRVVKLADFGCASFSKENTPTPLLVSRYYRPPEVMLGLPYSFPMDLWSLGCTLYELYTGKVCFAGDDNNEMMKLILDLKGLPSKKLIKKAQFRDEYFDEDFNFLWNREDRLTKTPYIKKIPLDVLVKQNSSPARDLKAELLERFDSASSNKPRVLQLYDLLDKIFTIDPTKRISIEEVVRHPFIA